MPDLCPSALCQHSASLAPSLCSSSGLFPKSFCQVFRHLSLSRCTVWLARVWCSDSGLVPGRLHVPDRDAALLQGGVPGGGHHCGQCGHGTTGALSCDWPCTDLQLPMHVPFGRAHSPLHALHPVSRRQQGRDMPGCEQETSWSDARFPCSQSCAAVQESDGRWEGRLRMGMHGQYCSALSCPLQSWTANPLTYTQERVVGCRPGT